MVSSVCKMCMIANIVINITINNPQINKSFIFTRKETNNIFRCFIGGFFYFNFLWNHYINVINAPLVSSKPVFEGGGKEQKKSLKLT